MACVLLFRDISGVAVDVVMREETEASMELPQHPVEAGAKITDHAWQNPPTHMMECLSQDVAGTWDQLYDVMTAAEPFTIVTGFTVMDDMVIQSMKAERDEATGHILKFTATLQKVFRVETQSTTGGAGGANGAAGPGSDQRGQGTTQRGQVQAGNVTSSQQGAAILGAL